MPNDGQLERASHTCVLYRRPSLVASQVLYETAAEGFLALAQDRMLRGERAEAPHTECTLAKSGSTSQNSAKAVLFL